MLLGIMQNNFVLSFWLKCTISTVYMKDIHLFYGVIVIFTIYKLVIKNFEF